MNSWHLMSAAASFFILCSSLPRSTLPCQMAKMWRGRRVDPTARIALRRLRIRRIVIKDIRIWWRTMREHHARRCCWTWMIIIINGRRIHGGRMMKTSHRLWLSWRVWWRAKSYFHVAMVRAGWICGVSQLRLFVARRGHPLCVTSRIRWIWWVEARLNQGLSRFRCDHWLQFPGCKRVHVSCLRGHQ